MKSIDRPTPRTQQEAFGTSAKLHNPDDVNFSTYDLTIAVIGVLGLCASAIILILEVL